MPVQEMRAGVVYRDRRLYGIDLDFCWSSSGYYDIQARENETKIE